MFTLWLLVPQGQPSANLYNQVASSPTMHRAVLGYASCLILHSFTFKCPSLNNKLHGHPTYDLLIIYFRVIEGSRKS